MIDFRTWPAIALVRSYFTLRETRATLSTNQITLIKTTHNYVTLVFPRFWTFAWFFLWVLTGSLFTFTLIGRCEVNSKEFTVWENKHYHEGDKIFFLRALCAFSLIFSFRSSICCSKEPITSSLQRKKKNYYNYYTEIKIFHFFQTLMQISFSKLVKNASDQTEGRERQFLGVCPKTENLTIKPCKMFGRVINDKFGYLKKSRQKPSICSSLKITTDLYPSYECFYLFPRLESWGCVKFPWSALQTMFTQWVEFLEKS